MKDIGSLSHLIKDLTAIGLKNEFSKKDIGSLN